jgi:GNAT superfamily N-acetyltransferase
VTSVRRATIDDARAIAEIRTETWRAAYVDVMPQAVLDGLDVDENELWWRGAVVAEGYAAFVGEQDGRAIGFASAGPCRDDADVAEVYTIYVRPGSWDTGAGRALMAATVDWMAERWSEAVLWVARNNPRARRFYELGGWHFDGERTVTFYGADVAEVRYRLSGLGRR